MDTGRRLGMHLFREHCKGLRRGLYRFACCSLCTAERSTTRCVRSQSSQKATQLHHMRSPPPTPLFIMCRQPEGRHTRPSCTPYGPWAHIHTRTYTHQSVGPCRYTAAAPTVKMKPQPSAMLGFSVWFRWRLITLGSHLANSGSYLTMQST